MRFIAIIGICVLVACETPRKGLMRLAGPGVSRELAVFREENFSQTRYKLSFSIPESRGEAIRGDVELSFLSSGHQPLVVDFRGEARQVRSVSLNGKGVPYEMRNEHISIASRHVVPGENRVAISFIAGDQSLNRRDAFLYTLLVPDRARTVFPCFDQPDMKALYSLTLEIPCSWQAVANGAVEEEDSLSVPGRRRITFRETEPLSTYLFSFVAGELSRATYSRNNREISIYHRETDPEKIAQCPDIAEEVFDALAWLEEFTGVAYPFAKYDLVILPGFQYGGMEHTGATLYADRRMFLDEHPALDDRLARSALVAHETAHMWFGDYVTMEWFDDVWTKEVFANYFASRIVNPLYPEVDHRLAFIRNYIPPAYSEDRTRGSNPIKQELGNLSDAGLVYGNIIYNKSTVMMGMLTRILGEEAFRQGIREYVRTYAYGNATWDGLIRILAAYTKVDLEAWSKVWVNEKGMPEITAKVEDGTLLVSQSDPLGRGLRWPQELSYAVVSGGCTEVIPVTLGSDSSYFRKELSLAVNGECAVIPNVDGRGYGFFKLTEKEARLLWAVLDSSDDEVLRGSVLITLYENLRRKTISPEHYRQAMLAYLPREGNTLLFSMALGNLGDCQRIFPAEAESLEDGLWEMVMTHLDPQHRLHAFRSYRSLARSDKAIGLLYDSWANRRTPDNCHLGENDCIGLSYTLALHLPEKADEIVATQQGRIVNPDRKKEYAFISPSVSPRKEDRDSVFASLLIAENRRVEPWAAAALANLNHHTRQQEAISYIRPALESMLEIQRTGDIFFPTAWVRALLSGHISGEARTEVEAFLDANPDYPLLLSNKIKQQSSHLY